ncbi:acyl-CoA thioesterase [Paracrocinitomix mangrovi]|uniref:acyl-CoA thioesterase n=1 Tax=Paracrocinitomix mangrovi TaxID=2862509 RepID=UPI001C8E1644|nr:acyl-CoA thioesterase [Paracrocinitomix mangrovi]UKN02772.1 acyl-CoA thioesterase [Paracrocinitomix mangrovi]
MIKVPIQVRFADCDIAGHIHNAVYLHYFESARMHFFVSQLGMEWDWRKNGIILKKNEVIYHSPGQLQDQLIAEVGCSHLGNSSFTLYYKIINQDGILRAEGSSVIVCMDYINGTTQAIPTEMLTALKAHPTG